MSITFVHVRRFMSIKAAHKTIRIRFFFGWCHKHTVEIMHEMPCECVSKVLTSINVAENIIFASKIWAKWKEHYYYYCCCCAENTHVHTHTHIIQYFPHYTQTEYLLSTTNIPFIYSTTSLTESFLHSMNFNPSVWSI